MTAAGGSATTALDPAAVTDPLRQTYQVEADAPG